MEMWVELEAPTIKTANKVRFNSPEEAVFRMNTRAKYEKVRVILEYSPDEVQEIKQCGYINPHNGGFYPHST